MGIINKEAPFAIIHMVWINTILNTLVVIALCCENPTDDSLKKGPFDPKEYIITKTMKKTVLYCYIYIVVSFIFLNFFICDIFDFSHISHDPKSISMKKHTIFLNCFVYQMVFSQFTCRKINANEFNCLKNITG